MPEGHTLHRLALDLSAAFAGTRPQVSSPQGRFAESAAIISGRPCSGAQAQGKHLWIEFEDHLLHIHLGLIGKFRIAPPAPPRGEIRVRIATPEVAADLSGPQLCVLRTPEEMAAQLAKLGPDPLRKDADPELAWARIHRSARPVAALLMDQTVLSGVGNVYRAEVLFRNRIGPHVEGRKLSRRSWDAIWNDLITLMPQGVVDNRIDTVRPEHTPEAMGRPPRVDDHGGEVYVYRRAGMDCLVCGSRVRTEVLDGRNLFWCGRCQRRS
ncbi:endonuclease VIII [Microlunatus endophyticus]|uniref:DNA-(apurinic or apyrimidinic site) lyase n=1 Tax=Microlunatus endophyticus TaxID=1716077 RepID=A0A917S666_9ACTN|nr:Fpg/Nei family DNA glycosylase [Microlunatus endophyticus]GGL60832.1 endonuclease VIII [Microlunatus endophyticus]